MINNKNIMLFLLSMLAKNNLSTTTQMECNTIESTENNCDEKIQVDNQSFTSIE